MNQFKVLSIVSDDGDRFYVIKQRTCLFLWMYVSKSTSYRFLELDNAAFFSSFEEAKKVTDKLRMEYNNQKKWWHYFTRRPKKITVYQV